MVAHLDLVRMVAAVLFEPETVEVVRIVSVGIRRPLPLQNPLPRPLRQHR